MREDIFNSDDGVLEYIHKENCWQAEIIPQSIAINRRYRENLPDLNKLFPVDVFGFRESNKAASFKLAI